MTIQQLDKSLEKVKNDLNTITINLPPGLPIGRKGNIPHENTNAILAIIKHHILGWPATVLAISIGAPFWFDLLNRVVNLKYTGSKPSSSSDAVTK